jgi:hypothetical protein
VDVHKTTHGRGYKNQCGHKYEGLGLVMWYSFYSWNILGIWLVVDTFWYATYVLQSCPQTINIEVKIIYSRYWFKRKTKA